MASDPHATIYSTAEGEGHPLPLVPMAQQYGTGTVERERYQAAMVAWVRAVTATERTGT